jgi:hypothetical protein
VASTVADLIWEANSRHELSSTNARHEIFNRVEELRELPGHHDTENQAIQDAVNNMRSLHKEQQEWTANQARRIG